MSTQASNSAAGAHEAAGAEWILALGRGAEPLLRIARAGSGKPDLTYLVTDLAGKRWIRRHPPAGPLLLMAFADGMVVDHVTAAFEAGLGAIR